LLRTHSVTDRLTGGFPQRVGKAKRHIFGGEPSWLYHNNFAA